MSVSPRVFTIGLDGGTFDLIDPLIQQGYLPNIGRLIENGCRATLNSVVLPFTPQAWGSFMTGMNPGNHGVFGFKEKVPGAYSFQFVNNRSIKTKTLWEYLTEQGKASILVNIPMTYPPENINGIVVGGMDAPGIDSDFVFPSDVKRDIFEVAPNYVIHLHVGAGYLDSDGKRRKAVPALIDMVDCREKLVLHFMKKYPWSFFAVNFSAIDQVQHHFWKYLDGKNEFSDAIAKVYARVDEAVGKICGNLPPNTTTYVMSDHGSGPASPYVFFVDEWLKENGWLSFQNSVSGRRVMTKLIKWALSFLSQKMSSQLKDRLMRWFPNMRVRSQGYVRRALIDWSNTRVFSGEHPSTLRINLEGRDPRGVVKPEEYESLRGDLIEKLESLRHPQTGERLIEKVHRKEQLYHGEHLVSAPDLIIHPKDFAHQVKGGAFPAQFYRQVVSEKDPREFFVSGVHRLNGVFVGTGPGIRKQHKLEPLDIYDLFPTILYSLGVEIPEGVDGQVATEIFEPAFLASHPIRRCACELGRGFETSRVEKTYGEDESEKIEESLKGLGYID